MLHHRVADVQQQLCRSVLDNCACANNTAAELTHPSALCLAYHAEGISRKAQQHALIASLVHGRVQANLALNGKSHLLKTGDTSSAAERGSHSLDRILMNMSPGLSRLKPLDQSQSAPAGRMQILDA